MKPEKQIDSTINPRAPVNPSESSGYTRKVGIIVLSRAIGIIAQMLALMILTRLLSKESFSLISFLLLAYSTVLTLGQLGLADSIFYFFQKLTPESRRALALQTGRTLFTISLFCAFLLLLIQLSSSLWGRELNGLMWPFMLLVLLELPTVPMPNILIAIDQTKDAGILNIFIGITQLLALVLPVILGYPLAFIVYSLLGYGALRFLFSGYLFLKYFKNKGIEVPKGTLLEQFKYAIPLSIAQIVWGLNRQIDKYVVEFFFPPVVFAEYIVGAWEIPLIGIIASSFASVMMPQLVSFYLKGQKENLLALWRNSIQKVSIIVLPLVVLFLIVAEEFIVLLASEKYIAAALPFRIYTVIIIQRVAVYSSLMKAIDETR
ncbi:MAG: oligosaccharide flippase family protein, partial [bacterium]